MKRLVLSVLLAVSCSAPRPNAARPEAVLSGDATAKAAAEAARQAEKEDNTGLIFASSDQGQTAAQAEPTTQPTEPEPAAQSTLQMHFVKGTLTMNGEPIADFAKVAADAVAADPDVILSIASTEEVDQAKITAVTDAAKSAGIKRVKIMITVDEPPPAPSDQPAKDAKKPQP